MPPAYHVPAVFLLCVPQLRQYQIVGRRQPTETNPHPQIFRMRVFAKNEVVAKSRFWYFLHQYSKMKKSTGVILAVNEVRACALCIARVSCAKSAMCCCPWTVSHVAQCSLRRSNVGHCRSASATAAS